MTTTLSEPETIPAETNDDPRCVPITLTAPIEEGDACPYPNYTAEEHETWKIMYARQRALLPTHACAEFLAGMEQLRFPEDRIPALADVSRDLKKATNWTLARSPGLLHEKDFFELLARRCFPSTDYIRPRSELDYTPAPDCFHDIFGHCPMITLPAFANFYQRIGQAAAKAEGDVRVGLVRIYWFTVEFGLVHQNGKDLIYGNGIASSYGEAIHSLGSEVERRPFVPERVAEQPYDIWHMQKTLFVVDSFEHLEQSFDAWAKKNGLL